MSFILLIGVTGAGGAKPFALSARGPGDALAVGVW